MGSNVKRLACVIAAIALAALAWYAFTTHRSPAATQLPKTMQEFKQVPGAAHTVDAGEFLIELAKAGKLPGFASGEHGAMQAANGLAPPGPAPENYPIARLVHFSKDGDTSDYFYIVVRETSNDTWRIQKACRMNPKGQVLDNYPVP